MEESKRSHGEFEECLRREKLHTSVEERGVGVEQCIVGDDKVPDVTVAVAGLGQRNERPWTTVWARFSYLFNKE